MSMFVQIAPFLDIFKLATLDELKFVVFLCPNKQCLLRAIQALLFEEFFDVPVNYNPDMLCLRVPSYCFAVKSLSAGKSTLLALNTRICLK